MGCVFSNPFNVSLKGNVRVIYFGSVYFKHIALNGRADALNDLDPLKISGHTILCVWLAKLVSNRDL
jgi:hypothetical protein